MFSGNTIVFNGVSSEEYGLMLVGKLDTSEQESGLVGPEISIVEDTIQRKLSPVFYTTQSENVLEFKLIFSVIDGHKELDRYDLAAISGWLYGHTGYKRLSIQQSEMADFYYMALATEIEPQFISGRIVGVIISFRCDAPYGYLDIRDDTIVSARETTYKYYNRSNLNSYYKPKMSITTDGDGDIVITNITTGETMISLSGLPVTSATIQIDSERQILTSTEIPNVYQYCDFNFPAFVKGVNVLQLTGNFNVTIYNNFPMYIGA